MRGRFGRPPIRLGRQRPGHQEHRDLSYSLRLLVLWMCGKLQWRRASTRALLQASIVLKHFAAPL